MPGFAPGKAITTYSYNKDKTIIHYLSYFNRLFTCLNKVFLRQKNK